MTMKTLNTTDAIYHDMLERILKKGNKRGDRTNTGTISLFGNQLIFEDIYNRFPLLTTKKVFMRGIFEELRWMLGGDSSLAGLIDKKVSIWSAWPVAYYNKNNPTNPITVEQFEEAVRARTIDPEHYDIGPCYGVQWRNWPVVETSTGDDQPFIPVDWQADEDGGGEFHGDIRVSGFDQIAHIVNTLRKNPVDRRMILSAWNAPLIAEMGKKGLPPCHMLFQFYTREGAEDGKRFLDTRVDIRSWDTFLGGPFNIAQYALLTHLIGHMVDMIPGSLVVQSGDTHIYQNHLEVVAEQLSRTSMAVEPTLRITCEPKGDPKDYAWEDVVLNDYASHPSISAPIAV